MDETPLSPVRPLSLAVGRRVGHSLDALRDAVVAGVGTGVYAIFINPGSRFPGDPDFNLT